MGVETEYLRIVKERFNSVKHLGDKTIKQLSEEDIHWAFNGESNSIAIIIKHVSGNMVSRWTDLLNSDGEKSYRNREQEFVDDISTMQELIEVWETGWDILFKTLSDLDEKDLLKKVTIRGESHSVIEAIKKKKK